MMMANSDHFVDFRVKKRHSCLPDDDGHQMVDQVANDGYGEKQQWQSMVNDAWQRLAASSENVQWL